MSDRTPGESNLEEATTQHERRGDGQSGDWIDGLKPGDLVGRYIVRDILGAGGMGVVFEAYDPMLDRRVALKVMRVDTRGLGSEASSHDSLTAGAQMLMREANGMAQISHPHVLPIFDVGWIDGRFFLTMELNVGMTLTGWLRAKPRRWQDIVGVMMQAATGLAAIHAVGLIHCDFKPGNLLVDGANNLRIADFGLAKRSEDTRRRERLITSKQSSSSQDSRQETRTHGHAGTLSYMAPEQHRGEMLDPRCDQFAFFVTLYQALFRQVPFRGKDHDEILAAVVKRPRESDFFRGSHRLPKWLLEALRCGLSLDPDARFADMNQVHEALKQGMRVSARRWVWAPALAGSTLAVALGTTQMVAWTHDPCDAVALRASEVWGDATREKLAQRFSHSTSSLAAVAWESLQNHVQDHVDRWTFVAQQQCQSGETINIGAQRCLDAALVGIGSAARVLLASSDETLEDPSKILAMIQDPQECLAHDANGTTGLPWPADSRQQNAVAALRDQITHVQMMGRAGDLTGIQRIYPELRERAQRTGYLPSWAELEFEAGTAYSQFVELQAGEEHLTRATVLAQASAHDEIVAWALTAQLFVKSFEFSFSPQLNEAIALARAAIRRAGDPPLLLAEWMNNIGIIKMNVGQPVEAEVLFRVAQANAGHLRGRSYLSTFERLNNVGISLQSLGKLHESQALLRQSLAHAPRVGRAWHPRVDILLVNLGRVTAELGHYNEAEDLFAQAKVTGARLAGRAAGGTEFACVNLRWLYQLNRRFDKALFLRKVCPPPKMPAFSDPQVQAILDPFDQARLLRALGYVQAANTLLLTIEQTKDETTTTTEDGHVFALSLLYSTAIMHRKFDLARQRLDQLKIWVDHHPGTDTLLLSSSNLPFERARLAWMQRYDADVDVDAELELAWAKPSSHQPFDRRDLDIFAAAYDDVRLHLGPSHPATLDPAFAYLGVLGMARHDAQYARVLEDILASRDLWAKEIPRRQWMVDLLAMKHAADLGDWSTAQMHFSNYHTLRDFSLDQPGVVAQVLEQVQNQAKLANQSDLDWLQALSRDQSQAQTLATIRASTPYSPALVEEIVARAANDPILAKLHEPRQP